MTTPEIEELKQLVKQKYGKTLATTTDFEEFSLYLKKKEDKNVSSSTLKRLYGYVSDEHKPRLTTLDPLAQYIGHADYKDFVCWLKNSTLYNSSFFMADQLTSSQLTAGTELVIGWSPNRMLTLRYLGESLYEVVTTENSKLLCGDRFVAGCFIKGQPLLLALCRTRRSAHHAVCGRTPRRAHGGKVEETQRQGGRNKEIETKGILRGF